MFAEGLGALMFMNRFGRLEARFSLGPGYDTGKWKHYSGPPSEEGEGQIYPVEEFQPDMYREYIDDLMKYAEEFLLMKYKEELEAEEQRKWSPIQLLSRINHWIHCMDHQTNYTVTMRHWYGYAKTYMALMWRYTPHYGEYLLYRGAYTEAIRYGWDAYYNGWDDVEIEPFMNGAIAISSPLIKEVSAISSPLEREVSAKAFLLPLEREISEISSPLKREVSAVSSGGWGGRTYRVAMGDKLGGKVHTAIVSMRELG